jgi:hypothetical protein
MMLFLAPLAFLATLIAIPILLLYMLRLRRREIMVSSNFLWQQVMQDKEANTPWQRLRRNLLLLLQLLILACLVLALARPAQVVATISAGKTVLLLDASASMTATDVAGSSRFEAAKNQARQIINQLGPNDAMSLIRVGSIAEPLTPYTSDIALLRTALNDAQAGAGAGDWQTALTLAAAGAEGAENFNIIIISDGRIPPEAGQLPEHIPQPIYIPIGQSADNLAISALATRTLPGQAPQLFAQVQNFGTTEATVSLVVRLDSELWDSAAQAISANSQRSFVFAIDRPFTTISAELVYDDTVTDYLTADNSAWTTAGRETTRRVLLLSPEDNLFLEQVLRSVPGVQTFRGDTGRGTLPQQPYDVYIFNNWLPETLPDADMFIINPPADTAFFTRAEAPLPGGTVLVGNRQHPLLTFIDAGNINIRELTPITAPTLETLLSVGDIPALMAGETNGNQQVIIPFDLRDSDLPLQIAFPILMANLLEWFTPASVLNVPESLVVGETVAIRPPLAAREMTVTLPDGTLDKLALEGEDIIFANTRQPGLYTLMLTDSAGNGQSYPFAVNLFSTGESDIAPISTLNVGGGIAQTAGEEQLSLQEYGAWVALAAFLIVLIEWYVYHQRLQIPTLTAPLRRKKTK